MIFDERAGVDFNWHTIVIEGTSVLCKKWGAKFARKTTKIWRLGNKRPVARTIGTSEIEDMTVEFDFMAGIKFLAIFGVSDFNPTDFDFAGRLFEMLDIVEDPRPVANNVGRSQNIYKDCEVISIETTGEVGETPTGFVVGISALRGTLARGAAGGGALV
jgi:hypothetical protein